jgi:hypothetical protein
MKKVCSNSLRDLVKEKTNREHANGLGNRHCLSLHYRLAGLDVVRHAMSVTTLMV